MTRRDDYTSTQEAAAFVAALHALPEPTDRPSRLDLDDTLPNPLQGPGYNGPCVVCGGPASPRGSVVKHGPLHAACERRKAPRDHADDRRYREQRRQRRERAA